MRTSKRNRWVAGPAFAGLILILGIVNAVAASNDGPEPYPTDACALNACYRSCDGLADQCYRNCDLKFMNDCNAKHSSTSTNHVTPIGGVKKAR